MKKPLKLTLGVFSVLPFVYMIVFFIFFITLFFSANNPPFIDVNPAGEDYTGFFLLFFGHLGITLISIGLIIYYLIFIFQTNTIDQNMKILWVLVLFFFGIFAFPVFWYLYIWKQRPTTTGELI